MTPDNPKPALDAIRRLHEAATKAPWVIHTGCSWRRISTEGNDGDVLCPTNHPVDRHPDLNASETDLELIAALRNAAGPWLAETDALRAEVERLRDSLTTLADRVQDVAHHQRCGQLMQSDVLRLDAAYKAARALLATAGEEPVTATEIDAAVEYVRERARGTPYEMRDSSGEAAQ